MRFSSILFSLLALLFSLVVICFGVFFIFILFLPNLHVAFLRALHHPPFLASLGGGLVLFGLLLLFLFSYFFRRSQWRLEMGETLIEDEVFKNIASDCFKEVFPGEQVRCEASIRHRKKLEIFADFPHVPFEKREELLEKIEGMLEKRFAKWCGYKESFFLNIQFDENVSEN